MARSPAWEQGVTDYLEKLEKEIKSIHVSLNARIDNIYILEITNLKVAMARLETQVKIYAAIAGAIGVIAGGLLGKLLIR